MVGDRLLSARARRDRQPLDVALAHAVLRSIFPRKNDYVHDPALFEELLPELRRWGIVDRGALRQLLTHHRRALLAEDRLRMSTAEQRFYVEQMHVDGSFLKDAARRRYFFAYPALVRGALEREFGEAASGRAEAKEVALAECS